MATTTETANEVFEVSVDGCKHYANARDLAGAQELARWCHERGYCYHAQPPQPGEVYELRSFTGNQPPRETWDEIRVERIIPPLPDTYGGYRHLGEVFFVRTASGRRACASAAHFAKNARRPLDPTPPGPPAVGDQPSLFDLETP